jgi:hypothetical protein
MGKWKIYYKISGIILIAIGVIFYLTPLPGTTFLIICGFILIFGKKRGIKLLNKLENKLKKYFKNEALEWSNFFFLIPLIIAVAYHLYWYSVVLLVVFIVSYDFHLFHEAKNVYYLDVVFSSILMLSNFGLLLTGHLKTPYSILALFSALIALLFYFRRSKHDYYINHSLWHIFSAVVCIFCLITYLSFI